MSYERFVQHMTGIANNSDGISVDITCDGDEYIARFSDGSTIVGNSTSLSLKYSRNN